MNRNTLILTAAILALLAMLSTPSRKISVQREEMILKQAKVDLQAIGKILIQSATEKDVLLVRKNESWVVDSYSGFPADASKISEFLQKLFFLKYGDRINSGSEILSDYGLVWNEQVKLGKRLTLQTEKGENLLSVHFGNERLSKGKFGFSEPSGQFVRVGEEEVVYLLKDSFSFAIASLEWILKKLPAFLKDEIRMVEKPGIDSWKLERGNAKEEFSIGEIPSMHQISKENVDKIVSTFSDLSFLDIVEENSALAMLSRTSLSTIEMVSFGGVKMSIEAGVKTTASANRYAKIRFEGINPDEATEKRISEWNQLYGDKVFGFSEYSFASLFKVRADLIKKETIKASHILISYKGAQGAASEISKEDAFKKAQEIITELNKGADFATLAKTHSTDLSNKEKGGDLGEFSQGDMVKPFEDAAYALTKGSYTTEPVETVYGYHIIRRN